MKDPEPYLEARGIHVPGIVDRGHPAVIDSSLRVFIGHDIFYFTGARQRDRFVADPLRWTKHLTDPVTLRRFAPSRRSPHLDHHGRSYYFATDSTRAAFAATPDSFAVRRGM